MTHKNNNENEIKRKIENFQELFITDRPHLSFVSNHYKQ